MFTLLAACSTSTLVPVPVVVVVPVPVPQPAEPVVPAPVPPIAGFSADPAHRGVAPGTVGDRLELRWRASIGIQGWHDSPVVVGDHVIVGSYGATWNECDDRDGVSVLDRRNGDLVGFWPTGCDTNGVSTDGERVYAVTDRGQVFAWTLDGLVVFKVDASEHKLYAAPTPVDEGLVVSGAQGFVAVLDRDTGATLRRFPAEGTIRNHSVGEGRVAWGTDGNHVEICELNGPSCVGWTSAGDDTPIYGAPAIDGGQIAIPGGYDGSASDEQLALLDLATGVKRWSHSNSVGAKASPAITADRVLFAESGYLDGSNPGWASGRLRAYDRSTGEPVWDVAEHGGSWSSPVVVGNRVVWIPHQGPLLILSLETGQELARFALHGPIHATPAVHDGSIYIGSGDGALYAFSTRGVP